MGAVRRTRFLAVGGFDEGVKATADHVDLCLTLRTAGHRLYLEPTATVEFLHPPPFAWYDLPFYLTRWSDVWARQTVAHLASKWGLADDAPFLLKKHAWTRARRRCILTYFLARACPSRPVQRGVDRWLTPVLDTAITRSFGRPAPAALFPGRPSN